MSIIFESYLATSFTVVFSEYGVSSFRTLDDLLVLINIATRYDFDGVRNYALNAIQQIPNLTPIQKINLSRQFGIKPAWILSSLTDLVRRYNTVSEEEAQSLGSEYVSKLSAAREGWQSIQSMRNAFGSLTCNDCRTVDSNVLTCTECGTDLESFVEVPSEILTPMMFVMDSFKLGPDGRPRRLSPSPEEMDY